MLLDARRSVLRFMVQVGQQVRQLLALFKSRRVGAAVSPGMGCSRGYSSPEWFAGMPARSFLGAVAVLPWLAARSGRPDMGVVLVSHALSMRVFGLRAKAVRAPRMLASWPV
ncbi:MAG: hypothetical protein C0423_03320 [Methylibium sp.]|nr:hypothetical protein [Methylibium sp.]